MFDVISCGGKQRRTGMRRAWRRLVMAGLVPAIHVLLHWLMAGGWIYIVTNRRNGVLYTGVTSNLPRCAYDTVRA